MRNLYKYLEDLKENGLMNQYSKKHFIIQAFNGDCGFFEKYPHLRMGTVWVNADVPSCFLANFSGRLEQLSRKFTSNDIESFVKDQLAAGKKNYSESQFFRAVSEVNVLSYLINCTGVFESAEYEPRVAHGKSNPEARIKFKDNIIIDVEVKTPGFTNKVKIPDSQIGVIKPNVIMDFETEEKMKNYYNKEGISIIDSRGLKLQSFIKSSSKKFSSPKSKKHFNILFINWTYTDFPECGLNEPKSLLINPVSGLLHSNEALKAVGLEKNELENISAIVLYRDNIETILSCDFRYSFASKNCLLILNKNNVGKTDFDVLCKLLRMNPINTQKSIEWTLGDYLFRRDIDEKTIHSYTMKIYDFLFSSEKLLNEKAFGFNFWKDRKDQILFEENLTIFRK